MRIHGHRPLLIGVLLATQGLRLPAEPARPLLIAEGRPQAQIVIAEDPPRTVRLAAAELQTYLEKISGARLDVVATPAPDPPLRIYVGRSLHTDRLGIATDDLDHGAFRIVSGPDYLALLGRDTDFIPPAPWPEDRADRDRATRKWDALTGEQWVLPVLLGHKEWHSELEVWSYDEQGSFNAVCAWLHQLSVRWYLPGPWGEVVPSQADIPLPELDLCVRPDFPVRDLHLYLRPSHASRDEILWRMRLGLNSGREILGLGPRGHGTSWVHGRKEVQQAHPEYFALWGRRATGEGAGGLGKPCLSDPGLFKANVRFARALFDHYREPMVSVMPADGYSLLCQCERCKGRDTPERGYRGRLSDYVWSYVDGVACELYQTHPGRKVSCFAYGTYLLPPLDLERLSPNLVVGFCQWRSLFFDPEVHDSMRTLREEWRRRMDPGGKFIVWEYYLHARPNRGWEAVPALFPHLIAEDLRTLKGISYGDFIEVYDLGPRWEGQALNLAASHLNLYVTARLLWDAEQDVGALLDEYYRRFYGPARREAKAFFEYCETNWPRMKDDVKAIDTMFELLRQARAVAGDSVQGKRLDFLASFTEPLRAARERIGQTGKPPVQRFGVPRAEAAFRTGITRSAKDGGWDSTLWTGQRKYVLKDCVTGLEPEQNRTLVIPAWAQDALFFTIRCYDRDMPNLNVTTERNEDEALWFGDSVDILIETHEHAFYQIAINPAGALVDVDHSEGVDLSWPSGAEVAVRHAPDLWEAQVRIPVQTLPPATADPLQGVDDAGHDGIRGSRPHASLPWFFNICRQRVREGEPRQLQAFSPTGQPSFLVREKFAELYVP